MKAISYIPSNDDLILKFRPLTEKPMKELGRFKLWWDEEGFIYGIEICPFIEELEEFKRNLNTIKLGGIWKNIKIRDKDIKKVRAELLQQLEEKW